MMFERDQQWGGGQQLLFLDDRVGLGGGVGFDFDGHDTGIVFSVPGCAAASLQELQDRASQQWNMLIPPP